MDTYIWNRTQIYIFDDWLKDIKINIQLSFIVITMKDIMAGASVGLSQVGVGHPFDTAKVLIQNKRPWIGLPISSYYKGWKFPLVSAMVFNCTVFPIYERTIEYTNNSFVSGFISGTIVTPLVYLFDIGKIKLQTSQKLRLNHFWTTQGKLATFNRETIAMSVYFGTYFNLKNKNYNPLLAGALAGLSNWTITYPLDVIKNRQIAQNISMMDAIKQKNLWKGFSLCATRACIVNAVNFWVYETVKKFLD